MGPSRPTTMLRRGLRKLTSGVPFPAVNSSHSSFHTILKFSSVSINSTTFRPYGLIRSQAFSTDSNVWRCTQCRLVCYSSEVTSVRCPVINSMNAAAACFNVRITPPDSVFGVGLGALESRRRKLAKQPSVNPRPQLSRQ